jgi:uncharacterized protein
MGKLLIAGVAGLIMGLGLAVSGMGNPANVIGFLDITGNWNPSLIFVMGGGLMVTFIGFKWLGAKVPTGGSFKEVDLKLVGGSALFGVGWGISGYCPGPALIALDGGSTKAILFFVAMIAGIALTQAMSHLLKHKN